MSHANPRFVSENEIEISIHAEQQKSLIEENREKVLFPIQDAFKNNKIELKFEIISESEIENRPLSAAEKYKMLKERNEALEILRQKFNLDIK